MLKNLFIIYSIFSMSFVMSVYYSNVKYTATKGAVWPKPKQQKSEKNYFKFDPVNFTVSVTGQTCDILTNAITRYFKYLRKPLKPKTNTSAHIETYCLGHLTSLDVEVETQCEEYPYFGMDESYDLTVGSPVKLESVSVWGALRGLETFVQLFYLSDDASEYIINRTAINDAPRYTHRGLLIDTSRHYISVENILKTIEAMSMNKMNVLHWHIVDDQSFPFQSERFPELSSSGAYDKTLVYTKYDIKTIVDYARDRGIRVIPEIDMPGHTRSWGKAFPNILTACYRNGKVIGIGPLNPVVNMTYVVVKELLAEVQDLFPDKYIHIGGNEVDVDCWKTNPTVIRYINRHNINSIYKLQAAFLEQIMPMLDPRSIPIVWQDFFDNRGPVSKNTIIQIWKNVRMAEEMKQIIETGHQVIFSSTWSIDRYEEKWDKFYMVDPRQMVYPYNKPSSFILESIVGGEAILWGDSVDDSNIISRTWPRASAVAERLWSQKTPLKVPTSVYQRIEEHACRMKRRGIQVEPPNGPGFCIGI